MKPEWVDFEHKKPQRSGYYLTTNSPIIQNNFHYGTHHESREQLYYNEYKKAFVKPKRFDKKQFFEITRGTLFWLNENGFSLGAKQLLEIKNEFGRMMKNGSLTNDQFSAFFTEYINMKYDIFI